MSAVDPHDAGAQPPPPPPAPAPRECVLCETPLRPEQLRCPECGLHQDLGPGRPNPFRQRAGGRERKEWPDETVRGLAKAFHVSPEVVLRRLVTLGLAPLAFYRRRREELLRSVGTAKARAGFGLKPAQRCLRDFGRAAVSTVFEARDHGLITRRDVVDYLGVRLEHVPDVERRLRSANAT